MAYSLFVAKGETMKRPQPGCDSPTRPAENRAASTRAPLSSGSSATIPVEASNSSAGTPTQPASAAQQATAAWDGFMYPVNHPDLDLTIPLQSRKQRQTSRLGVGLLARFSGDDGNSPAFLVTTPREFRAHRVLAAARGHHPAAAHRLARRRPAARGHARRVRAGAQFPGDCDD